MEPKQKNRLLRHELTERQAKSLDTITWLCDEGQGGTGRSFAIAVALIRIALRSPGRKVRFVDHYGTPYSVEEMKDRIRAMVAADPDLAGRIKADRTTFQLQIVKPIDADTWVPVKAGQRD